MVIRNPPEWLELVGKALFVLVVVFCVVSRVWWSFPHGESVIEADGTYAGGLEE